MKVFKIHLAVGQLQLGQPNEQQYWRNGKEMTRSFSFCVGWMMRSLSSGGEFSCAHKFHVQIHYVFVGIFSHLYLCCCRFPNLRIHIFGHRQSSAPNVFIYFHAHHPIPHDTFLIATMKKAVYILYIPMVYACANCALSHSPAHFLFVLVSSS